MGGQASELDCGSVATLSGRGIRGTSVALSTDRGCNVAVASNRMLPSELRLSNAPLNCAPDLRHWVRSAGLRADDLCSSGSFGQIAARRRQCVGFVRPKNWRPPTVSGSALGLFGQIAGRRHAPVGFVRKVFSAGYAAVGAGLKPAPTADVSGDAASNCRIANLRRDNARRS
jgi:hypothetical protein